MDCATLRKHPLLQEGLSRKQVERRETPPFALGGLWRARGDWRCIVDTETDPEGWTYAVGLSNKNWTRKEGLFDGVRRRMWVREYE